jgi:hypothetical protein
VYSYAFLEEPVAIEARAAAERIRINVIQTNEALLGIGKDLIAVKASLPRGDFQSWIGAEFGMSQSAAYKMMNVAEVFEDKVVTITNIQPSTLYALAAPKRST